MTFGIGMVAQLSPKGDGWSILVRAKEKDGLSLVNTLTFGIRLATQLVLKCDGWSEAAFVMIQF